DGASRARGWWRTASDLLSACGAVLGGPGVGVLPGAGGPTGAPPPGVSLPGAPPPGVSLPGVSDKMRVPIPPTRINPDIQEEGVRVVAGCPRRNPQQPGHGAGDDRIGDRGRRRR